MSLTDGVELVLGWVAEQKAADTTPAAAAASSSNAAAVAASPPSTSSAVAVAHPSTGGTSSSSNTGSSSSGGIPAIASTTGSHTDDDESIYRGDDESVDLELAPYITQRFGATFKVYLMRGGGAGVDAATADQYWTLVHKLVTEIVNDIPDPPSFLDGIQHGKSFHEKNELEIEHFLANNVPYKRPWELFRSFCEKLPMPTPMPMESSDSELSGDEEETRPPPPRKGKAGPPVLSKALRDAFIAWPKVAVKNGKEYAERVECLMVKSAADDFSWTVNTKKNGRDFVTERGEWIDAFLARGKRYKKHATAWRLFEKFVNSEEHQAQVRGGNSSAGGLVMVETLRGDFKAFMTGGRPGQRKLADSTARTYCTEVEKALREVGGTDIGPLQDKAAALGALNDRLKEAHVNKKRNLASAWRYFLAFLDS